MHRIRMRSACTARPALPTPSCWRWPPTWAKAIADRGWTLVWGGGNVSAMGALATAARAHGGWTVGVIPAALVRREVADHDADELIVTDTMRERKQIMEDRADAFITLPGGIGTLEEFFEAWTGGYLGMHDKPVVLLDPGGHFDGLRAWLSGLLDDGYVVTGSDGPAGGRRRCCGGDRGLRTPLSGVGIVAALGWPPSAGARNEGGLCPRTNSGDQTSVGLIDIASQLPGLLTDVPVIVRGVVTGLLAAVDLQDLDRQGLPGTRRPATATRCSSGSATSS